MNERQGKPHFHVTAALIRRQGRILITKRPQGSHLGGLWEFPGGKQEEGESLKECLEREIREELALEVSAAGPLCSVGHEYADKSITLHLFECLEISGSPLPREGQEARWVLPPELEDYTFPPPDRALIGCLRKSRTI
jgi:8-oxo-dGTP diphosphatase